MEVRQRRIIVESIHCRALGLRFSELALRNECHASCRVPDRSREHQVLRRFGLRQYVVPQAEAHLDVQRCQPHVLHHSAHVRIGQHVGVHPGMCIRRGLQRLGLSTCQRRRHGLEVHVVRVVSDLVHHVALRGIGREVRLVCRHGAIVGA